MRLLVRPLYGRTLKRRELYKWKMDIEKASISASILIREQNGLYCPGHHDLHSCGSGLPGRETPCRRKIYCSFHFGYMAYGDYTGKHRGHSGHVDTVSMLHDYAVCTNDDYGLVLHFNNKNQ